MAINSVLLAMLENPDLVKRAFVPSPGAQSQGGQPPQAPFPAFPGADQAAPPGGGAPPGGAPAPPGVAPPQGGPPPQGDPAAGGGGGAPAPGDDAFRAILRQEIQQAMAQGGQAGRGAGGPGAGKPNKEETLTRLERSIRVQQKMLHAMAQAQGMSLDPSLLDEALGHSDADMQAGGPPPGMNPAQPADPSMALQQGGAPPGGAPGGAPQGQPKMASLFEKADAYYRLWNVVRQAA